MATFSTETASTTTTSHVRTVFARPVAVRNEAKAEAAPFRAGVVGLIANYRAYKSTKGRAARGRGEAVLDLSALSVIPVTELDDLIDCLKDLRASIDAGIAAAEQL